jgi:hypothetical protein
MLLLPRQLCINFTCTPCIICCHATQIIQTFHVLQLFLILISNGVLYQQSLEEEMCRQMENNINYNDII